MAARMAGASRNEVVGDAPLLAILAAADEDEVELRGVEGVTHVHVGKLEADAARFAAVAQGDHVPAVAVDVHHIRVEVRNANGALRRVTRHGSSVADA